MRWRALKPNRALPHASLPLTELCEPAGNRVYSHDNSPDSWREDPVIDLAHAVAAQEALISPVVT